MANQSSRISGTYQVSKIVHKVTGKTRGNRIVLCTGGRVDSYTDLNRTEHLAWYWKDVSCGACITKCLGEAKVKQIAQKVRDILEEKTLQAYLTGGEEIRVDGE